MENAIGYINNFFAHLEIWEDLYNNKNYKLQNHNAILYFMDNCTTESAFKVYEAFFETYWIGTHDGSNPFIELIQKMKTYEENAGLLLRKQRDHYIHSVYVYILGLIIFEQNSNFKHVFNNKVLDNAVYKDFYKTDNEEFFYRWGIASLFHDIAYPLEISIKQINIYIDFISNHNDVKSDNLKVKMTIDNIEDFNNLPQLVPLPEFSQEYKSKYPDTNNLNLSDSIDIMAHKLNICFGIDLSETKQGLIGFALEMQNQYFIDHGYYSALIVLRWYYYLMQKANWNPAYFYYPIVDSASAILLHNYYKHGLMKRPFDLGKFKPESHPIAFLLILCDELQDWGRIGYGELDRMSCTLSGFDITISDLYLELIYIIQSDDERKGFVEKKISGINQVLDTETIFSEGINILLRKGE